LVARLLYPGASLITLDNGLRILVEEVPQSRSVSVGLWIHAGARDDPGPAPGLAHVVEHLVFKGTARRDAAQISREIDAVGGHLNAATSREATYFYVDAPADGLLTAVDVLTDLVFRPAFEPSKIDLERSVVLEEIRGHEDDPEQLAFDQFIANVWPEEHPLSRPILGTAESILALKRETIAGHHHAYYHPANAVLSAAGAVDPEALADVVRKAIPQPSHNPAPAERTPATIRPGRFHHPSPTGQTHIYYGLPGPSAMDEDRFSLEVVNAVLGDGTSSRLFQTIREERGLAYAVGSSVSRYTDSGIWMLYAGTSPAAAPEVLELIEGELRRLRTEPISDEEIALAKAGLRGAFILSLESNGSRSSRLGNAAVRQLEILSPDDVLAKLDAISRDDLARTIDRYLRPEALHLTVVGPDNPL